jgi:hypothetical protein
MAPKLIGLWWRLLALALYAVLVAAVFWVGFELGQARVTAVAQPEISTLQKACSDAFAEVAVLQKDLASLRQESAVLERSRQIEREANRSLQEQLKQAQDERLSLIKESSYLKRLIREGDKGAVHVHDMRVTPGKGPRTFRYSFTVTQLIQDFGESRGRVSVTVKGLTDGKETTLDLAKLAQTDPKELSMRFEHFQSFRGQFSLPEGFEPRLLTVTIEPEGDLLAGTSEGFPWVVDKR